MPCFLATQPRIADSPLCTRNKPFHHLVIHASYFCKPRPVANKGIAVLYDGRRRFSLLTFEYATRLWRKQLLRALHIILHRCRKDDRARSGTLLRCPSGAESSLGRSGLAESARRVLQPKERNIRDRSQTVPAKWLEGHTRQGDVSENTANPPAGDLFTHLFSCDCTYA